MRKKAKLTLTKGENGGRICYLESYLDDKVYSFDNPDAGKYTNFILDCVGKYDKLVIINKVNKKVN